MRKFSRFLATVSVVAVAVTGPAAFSASSASAAAVTVRNLLVRYGEFDPETEGASGTL
jgi:hypothetical protein